MSELTMGTLERGFRLGNWQVRPRAGELVSPWPRRAVEHVEPRAMQVLLALARHPGQFLSKDELLETVWARGPVTEDCLTRAIYSLRQAVGDNPRDPDYIETRQNVGYRLIAAVQPDKAATRTWIGSPTVEIMIRRRLPDAAAASMMFLLPI